MSVARSSSKGEDQIECPSVFVAHDVCDKCMLFHSWNLGSQGHVGVRDTVWFQLIDDSSTLI